MVDSLINDERPEFTPSIENQWIELITKCWDENPDKRPTFEMILNILDSEKFLNTEYNNFVFKQYKKHI